MIGIGQVKSFCKANGVKSILQTVKQEIHGVNPTLTYPPSGMSFELLRFCSVEMKQARTMNKIAMLELRYPINSNFAKATADDLKRLTSKTVEDSYKRVQWINPKDGEIYHLLDNGKTKDGKVIIRILDSDGAFVKEAQLKPKSIVIADTFDNINPEIPHGRLVEVFAKRNNPFAEYRIFNIPSDGHNFSPNDIADVLSDAAKKISADYLTLSIGNAVKLGKRHYPYIGTMKAFSDFKTDNLKLENAVSEFVKKKTRVLIGSGNNGETGINTYLTKIKNTEGVGSIEPAVRENGRVYVSNFSSSRNSGFTQHYEVGEFKSTPVLKDGNLIGYNFTGKPGCDISVSELSKIAQEFKLNLSVKSKKLIEKKESITNELEKLNTDYKNLSDKTREEKRKVPFESFFEGSAEIERKYQEQASKLKNEITDLTFNKFRCDHELKSLTDAAVKENEIISQTYLGTSLSTPARTAKLALNDMMEGIL